jgi:hypothetical protein
MTVTNALTANADVADGVKVAAGHRLVEFSVSSVYHHQIYKIMFINLIIGQNITSVESPQPNQS